MTQRMMTTGSKADGTATGKQSADPETKVSVMHLHQPMVWGELNVAKHSKDTDMESFRTLQKRWERAWPGA